MTAILVADNEAKWLSDMCRIIERRGYLAIPAGNPKEAMGVLARHQADIAVLDLRLKDNTNDYDISGLDVAADSDRTIPKIIVSEYASEKDVAKGLKIDIDSYPAIVDFVEKGEIETKLIPAVERALRVKDTWSLTAQTKISKQLNDDYRTARRDAIIHYWISLGISIVFAAIIFWGAYKLHSTDTTSALPLILIVVGVLVAEVTNYLFSRKLEFLSHRVERYHGELLQTDRFGQLLAMSYSIKDERARDEYKTALFNAATHQWLGNSRPLRSTEVSNSSPSERAAQLDGSRREHEVLLPAQANEPQVPRPN